MQKILLCSLILCLQSLVGCAQKKLKNKKATTMQIPTTPLQPTNANEAVIILGAGCFWCVEAVFQGLNGVTKVESGYSGGHVANPTYEEVCNKTTGHAEVCKLTYDTTVITLPEILQVFWQTHDPTTLNQQGADQGPQYRSAIYYITPQQQAIAEQLKTELNKSGAFANPIVTEITAYTNFYSAEDYHKNYYKLNPTASYCRFVVRPKVEKFEKVFKDKMKTVSQ